MALGLGFRVVRYMTLGRSLINAGLFVRRHPFVRALVKAKP